MAVEKVFCLMTYCEFFDLYCTVFGLLSNAIRLHRLSEFSDAELINASLTVRVSNEIKDTSKFYAVLQLNL